MGRITYSTAYPSSNPLLNSSNNKVFMSHLSGAMPSDGVPRLLTYNLASIATNASHQGTSQKIGMILTDGNGKTVTLYDTITTPTSTPSPITLSAALTGNEGLDWDNLQYIQLSGPSAMGTRQGTNYLYIDYVTPCGKPSNVKIAKSKSYGESVKLSWDAGEDGSDNPIIAYEIARKEMYSPSGQMGPLEIYQTVGASTTEIDVPPPETVDNWYYYRVRSIADAGPEFNSAYETTTGLRRALPELIAYTDTVLTAGQTRIKAVHMTQLQQNINTLRVAYGFTAYSFTAIKAGYTSLGGWLGHITEMRAAIDGMGRDHEAWIVITENRPSAAVMEQMRRVVAAL